ncbi:MAG TPA: single-stranded-DNA-specific exonuclease RecJ, partial [Thermoanaerobacterales bacterium]|nr:single-stranded-DNA-specific exonuclease RecJ [Thermoanaerobacterales bacterium]
MIEKIYKWKFKDYQKNCELETLLYNELGLPRILIRLLIDRGIKSVEEAKIFLNPKLDYLHDPFLMKDMDKAVDRINKALKDKEKIMIFGDYDVDGITATALLIKVFKLWGKDLLYYLPNRIEEGYGLNKKGINYAHAEGVSLIITVDCGISSFEEIDYAKTLGIDIIITDHHEPHEITPEAYGILNPKQKNCLYPYKELAGVGVAFKLCCGIVYNKKSNNNLFSFLDLVTIGTIADIVPLTGENRILVTHGLQLLNKTKNPGIIALKEVCDLSNSDINVGNISFMLAPRINATGRVGNPDLGVELLTCSSNEKAQELAICLDKLNKERQTIELAILEQSREIISKNIDLSKEKVIILASENWHPGVIGIVASKITEEYSRPSILISIEENVCKGSGRSIPSFDLFQAVKECEEYLVKYGGHEQAMGLTINRDKIQDFRIALNRIADKRLSAEELQPSIRIDTNINPEDISLELIENLDKMKPYGVGNPTPVFVSNHLKIDNYQWVGKSKEHIKLTLEYNNKLFPAIGFNFYHYKDIIKEKERVNIAYSIDTNEWNGNTYIDLFIKDIKFPFKKLSNSLNTIMCKYKCTGSVNVNTFGNKFYTSSKVFQGEIIDRRNISDKFKYVRAVLKKSDRVLIIVNNPLHGWHLINEIGNESLSNVGTYIYGDGYCIEAPSIIFMAPVFDELVLEKQFDDVVFYDMFFDIRTFKEYIFRLNITNLHIIFGKKDFIANQSIFRRIYPDREILENVYLCIKK